MQGSGGRLDAPLRGNGEEVAEMVIVQLQIHSVFPNIFYVYSLYSIFYAAVRIYDFSAARHAARQHARGTARQIKQNHE
jgi:hypothetical protein